METFNEPKSFVCMGRHKIAPPTLTLDAATAASYNLNTESVYLVTVAGQKRACVFRWFHGAHAMFYSPMNDWTLCVYHTDIPTSVKEIE